MTVVFMFPGQNSRRPDMIDTLVESDADAARTLERASDILRRDLRAHFRASNPDIFARNRDVQVGVFLASLIASETLARSGVTAHRSLGLSLGEYNHLVHIGAVTLEQALPLIEARGIAYEQSPMGAMAASFPLEAAEADAILERLGLQATLAVGMCNAPKQQVFSGERAAVERACQLAQDEYFAQSITIEDRLPMHSPLFRAVADRFRPALEAVAWQRPITPYLPNVTGRFIERPDAADFVDCLGRHLHQPVLWRQSIDHVQATCPDAVFIEVGPQTVLSNLLRRRWVTRPVFHTDGPEPVSESLAFAGQM